MLSRLRILVAVLLALAVGGGVASASPKDVLIDFEAHSQTITQNHSWSDLRGSVELARIMSPADTPYQEQLSEEVQRVISQEYLGLETPPPATLDAAELPSWVVALGTATLILIAAGIASAIWRRTHPLR